MAIEIRLRKNENMDKVLRKLKKALDSAGTLKDLKERMYFESPSEKRRKKSDRARSRARRDAKIKGN